MSNASKTLLETIHYPSDLRKLDESALETVCSDLREFIIDHVSVYGGHFGASLGVVELTTALHYVYNTPYDQLVWDVGHQAYGHKILTGRREDFHTNRTYKGISGFPKRDESEYDTFGVGHASTSISATLGMAIAAKHNGDYNQKHVAIIGDGALTGGISFEGLNHAGVADTDMLVILNDNCMSIDPNVGALKNYLTNIAVSEAYNKIKDDVWHLLGRLSSFGKGVRGVASKLEHGIKTTLLHQSNFFESLNFRYFGPIDGHDIKHLVSILRDIKKIKGPKILHCITTKGKGYQPAEHGNKTVWHSPGVFDKVTGKIHKIKPKKPQPPKYQDVFGHTMVELAEHNDKIVGITPAMPSGSSMNIMMEAMPDRAFDVGIAEQHAVTFSAGLATQGLIPFCNIYSSFMQRAYDQVIHDVCLQNLPVNFCLDRAGLVGADGPTHHGVYDMAYFRCIPNMIIASPMHEESLRNLMYTASLPRKTTSFCIRYPRGRGVMTTWRTPFQKIPIGKGRLLHKGQDIAVLTLGHVGNHAATAIKSVARTHGVQVTHCDMQFLKPLDQLLLHSILKTHRHIITVEDGCITGGFGSAILEFIFDNDYRRVSVHRMGIPDRFVTHGTQKELHHECQIDAKAIEQTIKKTIDNQPHNLMMMTL